MIRSLFGLPARALLLVLTALALLVLGGERLRAHEGEDHGAPASGDAGGGGDTVVVAKGAQFLLGIRTIVTARRELSPQVQVSGTLTARPEGDALLSAPQSGRIVQWSGPAVGTAVRRGTLLATVEGSLGAPERADLVARQAEAEAALAQARADLERLRALSRVVARREIEAAEIRLRAAESVAQAGAALSRNNRYELRAPFDGVLAAAEATLGQQVEPGQTLFRVVDLSRLRVTGQVFEADLGRLGPVGSTALVTVPALGDTTFSARLIALGGVLDPASRTVPVIFEIANADRRLRVGQQVEIGIPTGAPISTVTLPEGAVVRSEAGPVVFLHVAPEWFVQRPVALGPKVGDVVAIASGLRPGERVVTTGVYELRNAR